MSRNWHLPGVTGAFQHVETGKCNPDTPSWVPYLWQALGSYRLQICRALLAQTPRARTASFEDSPRCFGRRAPFFEPSKGLFALIPGLSAWRT